MEYVYKTKGTCSSSVSIDIADDGTVNSVSFCGGCNGNTKGISALVKGMNARDIIDRLSGIRCGLKGTSCPDQLATALKQILDEKQKG